MGFPVPLQRGCPQGGGVLKNRSQNTEVRMGKPCSVVARYDSTNAPQLITPKLLTSNLATDNY